MRPGHRGGVHHKLERAVEARESARARVRLATGAAVVTGLALTGTFAALAAGSTHLRKTVRERSRHVVHRASTRPVVAPAPPLVSVGGSAPQPSPSPSPAPAPAPVQTQAPPVVVSSSS